MSVYNVEIFDRTARRVIDRRTAHSEREASEVAKSFIDAAKRKLNITDESTYDISPRGFIIGQTLVAGDAVFQISTGIMKQ